MNAHFARLVVVPAELGGVGMLLAKITLLLAAAWVVQAAIGRLNPRLRVLVWRVTGIAILLLCVLALSPPFVRLAILPGPTAELAAGDTANPATSLGDRAELRDPNRRIPAAADATEAEQLTQSDETNLGRTTLPSRLRNVHADPAPASRAVDAMPEQPPSSDNKPAGAPATPYALWLLGLWCAGTGLSALVTLIGLLRLRAIRRIASSVPDGVQSEADRVASALGVVRGFDLRQTQSLQTPCLVGVFGPLILLPARQCESRYADELPAILAHELAHLKGADLFWNALLNALAIGLWFHPLAWRMRLAHADACDAVCDALASDYVGDAGIYGRTLARLTLRSTQSGAAPGLAMARVSSVERRIAAVRRHVFRAGLSRRRGSSRLHRHRRDRRSWAGWRLSRRKPSRRARLLRKWQQRKRAVLRAGKAARVPEDRFVQSQGTADPRTDAKSPTLEKVFAAWKARQERIKSFYFAWELRAVLPKGYQFPLTPGLFCVHRGDYVDDRREIKWVGVALDADKGAQLNVPQWEWSGEGLDRLRSDFSNLEYTREAGWKETERYRITRAGSLNSLLKVPTSSAEPPSIAIWRKVAVKLPSSNISRNDLWDDLATDQVPLRLAVRPLSTLSDWSPANTRILCEDALNGNSHCIQLQMDKVDHSERCWVDPKRDYSVVRWERRDTDIPPLDVAIVPQHGPDGEWLPAQWSWRLPGASGGEPASFAVTVTRRTVNQKLPDKTFDADYPSGTRVYDARVDLPIVASDDSAALLPPDEARATLKAVADAWLQRQTRVKRFKYTWREDHLRQTINTVCLDGEKFMKEFKTPEGAAPSRQFRKLQREIGGWPLRQSKTVFDGVNTRSLWFSGNPQRPEKILDIAAGSRTLDSGFEIDHLILVYRPFAPRFKGINVAELRDPARFRVRKQKGAHRQRCLRGDRNG